MPVRIQASFERVLLHWFGPAENKNRPLRILGSIQSRYRSGSDRTESIVARSLAQRVLNLCPAGVANDS